MKKVAIVGARGAVGSEMRRILEKCEWASGELRLFGSSRSKGQSVSFRGKTLQVEELAFDPKQFDGVDIVLSSPGASVSQKFVRPLIAHNKKIVVIDNTSAFRMDADVPLVVPEVNGNDIKKHKGIIANPNCSAIVMLIAIAPLHRANRIKRVIVSTYQSASGAGAGAMRELYAQTQEFIGRIEKRGGDALEAIRLETENIQKGKALQMEVFPHQIAFNLFSHNSNVAENGYTGEENKMIAETKKILGDPDIQICPTAVRVPVFQSHAESVLLEFEKPMSVEAARQILSKAKGVTLVDDRAKNRFPMPFTDASGRDDVYVGRIREDLSSKTGLALFVAGDQLRKGAALNAVQIAELLI
ncbi:MAG: aspartate-semialdehyde dehydrogenase [Candidatus Omnitrophica bacterium CG11_big_fil_rev_8_21_14_0_20_45_26]|uniref:Aspartate-semialdehyde dehydrogenase n=1 Tax=Candidatus Abzuiibacterium crystallinum TaxID=1974748 RepID=A0A2H0LNA4_9BACT|nr:MAG: aspartate-semialdehyde dehydrogenase [Candidatus Omnitrophica bacterium CG11_big_fil_rev_8_21_14_0_20_45_26]PIW63437.1 MAG: aspartate-semialdehyde dehydrogenase [Candidatus Omnitrophica bacterium CG12_big_fil_rev_8_21_14_0_65_45_16]